MASGPKDISAGERSRDDHDCGAALQLNERERLRIAFDLHDGPAQAISAALLQARLVADTEGTELRRGLEELTGLLTFALDDMYGIIEHLRSRALDNQGLVPKVEAYVKEFASRADVDVAFVAEGPEVQLSDSMQIAVFRIIQEALSNVARHAHARHVDVGVRLSEAAVTCTIADDGKGFQPSELPRSEGTRQRYGLIGMCERARLLDGECVVTSEPGHGTYVAVTIPVWRGEWTAT